jgi:hypothetical protein
MSRAAFPNPAGSPFSPFSAAMTARSATLSEKTRRQSTVTEDTKRKKYL